MMTKPRTANIILIAAALALLCASHPARAQRPEAQASANEKFERGKRLLEQGEVNGAIPLLRDAAELRKKDAGAWFLYGLALSRAGRTKDARKAFEKALKLQPDDAAARTGLAYSLFRLNKPRDAEREARRALQLAPQNAEARYIIGAIRYREDKFAEAAEEAETALRIKPDLFAAAYLAGDVLLSIYVEEGLRQVEKYPLAPTADESERKAVFEKRALQLEPLKAKMREVADRLQGFVKSQPNNPAVEQWREQAETLRFYGRGEGDITRVFPMAEVTARAVIISKPDPGFTEEARKNNVTGVVRLRAVLAADGRIRHILVIKRLPDGLTERCIEAARNIRFKPATLNGVAVSQFIQLEYNFNIY